ncbi:hypothetical protein GCM10010252_04810 [Streptomyces aureoverticillatus]|nr:hypothetical protein GCM10010252_04810 [Streptomyces aureoverticillatus]
MGDSGGGGTSFESMSHEQMLEWLDQANSGVVQAAADRLVAAATEIRKIADELKVRPQWVRWKGEGATAFRTWSGDLANSTHRLGDFSEQSAKWLARASEAIATAQASIPRDKGAAQANLKAAQAAPNDPDARAVGAKSAGELAKLEAAKEQVRQEAAAEMRKLGQAYQLSAQQLEGLERPRFPPLPAEVAPPPSQVARSASPPSGGGWPEPSGGERGGAVLGAPSSGAPKPPTAVLGPSGSGSGPDLLPGAAPRLAPQAPDPVGVQVDGTTTLPDVSSAPPSSPPGGTSTPVRPDGTAQPIGLFPPPSGQQQPSPPANPTIPPGPGPVGQGGRTLLSPRGGPVGPPPGRAGSGPVGPAPGRTPSGGQSLPPRPTGPAQPVVGGTPRVPPASPPAGRMPGGPGIVGGCPTPSVPGGPIGGMPRGAVAGGSPAGTGPGGSGAGRGAAAGQRPMGAPNGIAGGQPRRQASMRGAVPPNTTQPSRSRRDEERDGRPDYLTEDQETWRPDGRRVVPPVVD